MSRVTRWSDRIKGIEGFPAEKAMLLRHLILSHQGLYEHATPALPQTREAFLLYYADEMDSKMGALDNIEKKTGDKPWSEYVRLIDRYIYFGRGGDSTVANKPAADTAGGGE